MTLDQNIYAAETQAVLVEHRAQWRMQGAGLALALGAVIAVFWDTVAAMVGTWASSDTYNHAFFIVPISLYLIWTKRDVLLQQMPMVDWPWLGLLLCGAAGWLVGRVAGALVVEEVALVVIIQSAVVTLIGRRAAMVITFPLLYLFFAVPIGDFLIPTLQDLTASFVVNTLQLINIPVFHDGILISIPTGDFQVAKECAGVRFLIATLALGFLFAHLMYKSLPRRLAFIGLAIIVPIVANWLRAFGIVYIAYRTNNEVAVGVDHIIYGWGFFAFVTIVLLGVGLTFAQGQDQEPGASSTSTIGTATAPATTLLKSVSAVLSIVILTGGMSFFAWSLARAPEISQIILKPPEITFPWRPGGDRLVEWEPVSEGAHSEYRQSFIGPQQIPVHLYVALYAHQRQGAEITEYGSSVTEGPRWIVASRGTRRVEIDGGVPIEVVSYRVNDGRRQFIIWRWYWVNHIYTANRYIAKVQTVLARLFGNDQTAAVIALATEADLNEEQGHMRLQEALSHFVAFSRGLEIAGVDLRETAP